MVGMSRLPQCLLQPTKSGKAALRPEGTAFRSHVRKVVGEAPKIISQARRADTSLAHTIVPHLRRSSHYNGLIHALTDVATKCRTFGATSSGDYSSDTSAACGWCCKKSDLAA